VTTYWEGKVVFITGASSGIGAALARALGRCGAAVGLMARSEQALKELGAEIEAEGSRAAVVACDVRERAEVLDAIAVMEARLGPADVMIVSAAVSEPERIHAFELDRVAMTLETNLIGALNAFGAVIPGMVERGRGHLVGISSVASLRGAPGMAAYAASKAGLSTLLDGLRPGLRAHGVAVTVVQPGFVDTPFSATVKSRPFLVSLERTVVLILRGMERRRRLVAFPWPIVWLMRLMRLLPGALWDRMVAPRRRMPAKTAD